MRLLGTRQKETKEEHKNTRTPLDDLHDR